MATEDADKSVKDRILSLFRSMDSDGDGSLSQEELQQVLAKLGTPEEDIPAIFAAADLNNDGKIDFAEFIRWVWGGEAPRAPEFDIPEEEPESGASRLDEIVEQVFKCFDADQDDQIEREEFLACWEKLAEILDESFGPKQRKVKVQWFKDSGAEGTPLEGMYLSKENWRAAYLAEARSASGFSDAEPGKLAAWIWGTYAQRLVHAFFPPPKEADEAGDSAEADTPAGPPPEYPLTIALTDLSSRLEEAKLLRKRVLVLSSGLSEVNTFLNYKIPSNLTLDARIIASKPKAEVKTVLCTAMEYEGLCASVHLRMADKAFDWGGFCCDEFPADVFSARSWTSDKAAELGFISEAMKQKCKHDPKRWRDFQLVLTSSLDLEGAKANGLADKVPCYSDMAILVVDPGSVAA